MLTDFILSVLSGWKLQLCISIIALSLYLFNKSIIKTKMTYGFRNKDLLLFVLPYFNICFLILNVLIMYINFGKVITIVINPICNTFLNIKRRTTKKTKKRPQKATA